MRFLNKPHAESESVGCKLGFPHTGVPYKGAHGGHGQGPSGCVLGILERYTQGLGWLGQFRLQNRRGMRIQPNYVWPEDPVAYMANGRQRPSILPEPSLTPIGPSHSRSSKLPSLAWPAELIRSSLPDLLLRGSQGQSGVLSELPRSEEPNSVTRIPSTSNTGRDAWLTHRLLRQCSHGRRKTVGRCCP